MHSAEKDDKKFKNAYKYFERALEIDSTDP
jgi:hypothetical protein